MVNEQITRRNFLKASAALAAANMIPEIGESKNSKRQTMKPTRIEIEKSFNMENGGNDFYVSFDMCISPNEKGEPSQDNSLYVFKRRARVLVGDYHKSGKDSIIVIDGENPLENSKIIEMIKNHLPLYLSRGELDVLSFNVEPERIKTITNNLDSLVENTGRFIIKNKEYFPIPGMHGKVTHVNYQDMVSYNYWSHLEDFKVHREKSVGIISNMGEIHINDERGIIKKSTSFNPRILKMLKNSPLPKYVKELIA